MAGDWIKWSKGLTRKSEVIRMASAMHLPPAQIAGHLMEFWEWADDNSYINENGDGVVTLGSLQPETLDQILHAPGLSAALMEVGWLTSNNGILSLLNFGRHNGETAKTRALGKNRVEKCRAKKQHPSVTDVTEKALPEKRREESNTPQPPCGGQSEIELAALALFQRPEGTGLDQDERSIIGAAAPTKEEIDLMRRFRAAAPEGIKLRGALKPVFRHWKDEMDKARAWGQANKPKPSPLPPASRFEESFQAIRSGFDLRRDMAHIWNPDLELGLKGEIEKLPLDAWDEMSALLRKNCEEMIG